MSNDDRRRARELDESNAERICGFCVELIRDGATDVIGLDDGVEIWHC